VSASRKRQGEWVLELRPYKIPQIVKTCCAIEPTSPTVAGLLASLDANYALTPILADALEDAGCENAALLEALRMT
jgi:hypothetical protein